MEDTSKVDVVLKTAHEHEGHLKNKGDVISVYPDQANRLIESDVAEKSLPKAPLRGAGRGDSK